MRRSYKPLPNLNSHQDALEHIVNHLDIIDIERKDVSWIIKEPKIYAPGRLEQEAACDIIVGYDHYKDVDLIELKHSYEHIDKAIQQLNNTEQRLVTPFGYRVNHKYIVFYPFFNYEII